MLFSSIIENINYYDKKNYKEIKLQYLIINKIIGFFQVSWFNGILNFDFIQYQSELCRSIVVMILNLLLRLVNKKVRISSKLISLKVNVIAGLDLYLFTTMSQSSTLDTTSQVLPLHKEMIYRSVNKINRIIRILLVSPPYKDALERGYPFLFRNAILIDYLR